MPVPRFTCPNGCSTELQCRFDLQVFSCFRCRVSTNPRFVWSLEELRNLADEGKLMKEIQVCKTYNNTIIELKFIIMPGRGWFDTNIKPAIDFIKQMVPATAREYNTSTNKWSIGIEYWPPLAIVLKDALHFTLHEVTAEDAKSIPNIEVPKEYAENFHYKQEVISSNTETASSIAEKLSVFLGEKITTQELTELKKLYRKRALELHPDRNGGDGSKMSELNRLWTLYCNTGVIQ
jgi:hypothetical protein